MKPLVVASRQFRRRIQKEPSHVQDSAAGLLLLIDRVLDTKGLIEYPIQKAKTLEELSKFEIYYANITQPERSE